MKIILLKSHDNLGNVGEIINVKSGFARNYLIANIVIIFSINKNHS